MTYNVAFCKEARDERRDARKFLDSPILVAGFVSCLLFLVSCLLSLVSYFLSLVSCFLSLNFLLSNISQKTLKPCVAYTRP